MPGVSGPSQPSRIAEGLPSGGGQRARVHYATGRDVHYVHVSQLHGVGFGGDPGQPGLGIDHDLAEGLCMASQTYGDTSGLASQPAFKVGCVQLWDLTPREPGDVDGGAGHHGDTVLRTHNEGAMLLPFIKMERQVGGMRI